jgi:hypothetical protein
LKEDATRSGCRRYTSSKKNALKDRVTSKPDGRPPAAGTTALRDRTMEATDEIDQTD